METEPMTTAQSVLLLVALGAGPGASRETVRVHDLAALTPAEAEHLAGRRVLYQVRLDSLPGGPQGWTDYDCVSPDATARTVRLYPGQEIADEMIVEADLQELRHDPAPGFPGFTEFRLLRAVARRSP
jgi:hypothetical protein